MDRLKTFFFMALLTVILVLFGGLIGGEEGLIMAFFFALVINFISFWFSDKIAITMTRSRPLSEQEAPEVYEIVQKLAQRARMPMPKIYLTPTSQPNAFATGRSPNKAAVAVTEGILRILSREELEGVIAHELAHIKNRDTLISTMAAVMAGALAFLARMGHYRMLFGGRRRDGGSALIQIVAIIFAPLAAMIIRMAISRSREFVADETGARIAGSSRGLASALMKMQRFVKGQPMQVNEATAHLFILNPISAKGLGALFSTHPPTEERVKRLKSIR